MNLLIKNCLIYIFRRKFSESAHLQRGKKNNYIHGRLGRYYSEGKDNILWRRRHKSDARQMFRNVAQGREKDELLNLFGWRESLLQMDEVIGFVSHHVNHENILCLTMGGRSDRDGNMIREAIKKKKSRFYGHFPYPP